jgi:hypothetical protein
MTTTRTMATWTTETKPTIGTNNKHNNESIQQQEQ